MNVIAVINIGFAFILVEIRTDLYKRNYYFNSKQNRVYRVCSRGNQEFPGKEEGITKANTLGQEAGYMFI